MPRHPRTIRSSWLACSVLSALAAFLSAHPLFPQDFKFNRLSVEQGLSQSVITCILQDSRGFMWFGTQDGLNKYDGYTFTAYNQAPQDSTSLSDNYVWTLYEDRLGTLWVGTDGGGLNRFDKASGRFAHFRHDPDDPHSISDNHINAICEDGSGRLWVGTAAGLNLFDRDAGRFSRAPAAGAGELQVLNSATVEALHKDHLGSLWIGTLDRGLSRLDPGTGQITRFISDPNDPATLGDNHVHAIHEDRAGSVWVGTSHGVSRFDRATGKITRFHLDPMNPTGLDRARVNSICEDSTGALWFGTWTEGLHKLKQGSSPGEADKTGDRARFSRLHFLNDPADQHSLSHNQVRSVYVDRAGILWIGTWGGGINKLDPRGGKFRHFTSTPADPTSLSDPRVTALLEDRSGALWIGTDVGLNRFDGNPGRFTRFLHDPKNPRSLSHNRVLALCEDSAGALWVGTVRGLDRFDGRTGQFTRYQHEPGNPHTLNEGSVFALLEDCAGTLWVGAGNGLTQFNHRNGRFASFTRDPDDAGALGSVMVLALHEDHGGTMWVGTRLGLNRVDGKTGEITRYRNDPKDPSSLSHNLVCSIYEDRSGTLWVGTYSGLNRFDGEARRFVRYSTKDGLPNATIYGILEDDEGRLWLSTNKGLSCFDPGNGVFRNYDATDGLQGNEFNFGAYHKRRNGELLFGGLNGFNAFHPEHVRDNPYIPPTVITAFKIFGEPAKFDRAPDDLESIQLSNRDNFFSFEFAALSYAHPKKNQYAYKMDGLDPDWIYGGTRRYASYTNLDPGEYIFRVKASNNDGVWNEEGTSIRITITPPWWRRRWALALFVMAAVLLLFGVRQYELNRIKLKNRLEIGQVEAEKLRELDQLKSRFFANISHEFRTPLTLILGQIEAVLPGISDKTTTNRLKMAERNTHRLHRLINQLLDLSKVEGGEMKLRAMPVDLIRFLRHLIASFESVAADKRIDLEFEPAEGGIDRKGLQVYFDPEKMEKVFLNLLSNGFKFTPEGGSIRIGVSLARDRGPNGHVLISVADTGIGIPENQLAHVFDRFHQVDASATRTHEGTGIGLALARELVELHRGSISVRSQMRGGTEFLVRLPLGHAHLHDTEIVAEKALTDPEYDSAWLLDDEQGPIEDALARLTEDSGEMILIIEDKADVRAYISEQLQESYRIIEAGDGKRGLAAAVGTMPDLIITDVMMPGMDGYELARRLRNDERTSHIPIIMLTARASEEAKIKGLKAGVDEYLTKPFSTRELVTRVRNLIDLRRQLRRRFSQATTIRPSEVAGTSLDQAFLGRVVASIEAHMGDERFGVHDLAGEVNMSVSQVNRKLNALIDQPGGQLIRSMRLRLAADLLVQKTGTIAEVAYQVGFTDQAHFTRSFRKQFGRAPSEYKAAVGEEES